MQIFQKRFFLPLCIKEQQCRLTTGFDLLKISNAQDFTHVEINNRCVVEMVVMVLDDNSLTGTESIHR